MHIKYAAQSKAGEKRTNNEDSYKIVLSCPNDSPPNHTSMLFAVADGMGGHPCGEVASMMACKALDGFFEAQRERSVKETQSVLVEKFYSIDTQIKLYTKNAPACLHMGTTLSVFVMVDGKAIIAHVGDTRVYCLRDGKLKQMTIDHTFVQDMVDRGLLAADKVSSAPHRNVLTQVVGTDEPLGSIYTQTLDVVAGDRFLLSTDGLHDTVSFHDIELMMRNGEEPEVTSLQLLAKAIDNGTNDDISMLVIYTT